jgi:Double-GTPase 2
MPQLIAALIGIALYVTACYYAFVWVVVPTFPFVVVGGFVCGVLLVVSVMMCVLLRVERFAAATVGPGDAQIRLPGTRTPFPRDDAWPHYLFAQWRDDLGTAANRIADLVGRAWTVPVNGLRKEPGVLFAWPLLLVPATFLACLTGGAVVAGLAAFALCGIVLGIARLGWLAAVGVSRGLDLGVRKLRRAKATCHRGECSNRSMLPAYRCPCGVVHHDIRAGRQGVLLRRCRCDRLLPTTVLQAAAGLVPVCQNCNRELRAGAGTLTDVVVPVFGPVSAGKTRFILAAMVALGRHQTATGGSFQPVGPESEAAVSEATRIIDAGRQTAKTASDRPPAAVTVRLGSGRRKAHLQLFDAAGEFFGSREQNQELRYLADSEGFVFVLDPFSIPAVVDEMKGEFAPRLAAAHPALAQPEPSYLVTVQWLRDQGVDLRRTPLAIALVKSDLLLEVPPGAGLSVMAGSADVANWLQARGLDNLIAGAERDFAEVRYFLVSSLDDVTTLQGRAARTSPGRPLLWLLARSGVGVTEEKEPVPS